MHALSLSAAAGRLGRQPFVHFLVLGGLLFAAYAAIERANDRERIVVSAARADALVRGFASLHGHAPSAAERKALVDDYVRDEVLYREAARLGLDEGDVVVRRRLIQNMEFVLGVGADADADAEAQVSEAEIERWTASHPAAAGAERLLSAEQVFFGDDESRAREQLARGGDPRGAGLPFIAGERFERVGPERLDALFGEGFFAALSAATPDRWTGPIRSDHGWHLVRVDAEVEAPAGERLRERARREILRERERAGQARRVDELVAGYRVEIESTNEDAP